jgi:PD-(D/E)XK nuclease superfamily protein
MSATTQKGAIAEAAIALEATRLGFVVSRPMTEGRRYDLIVDTGPRLLRVQCKWGRRQGNVVVVKLSTQRLTPAGYVQTTYQADEIDGIAVYCQEVEECYFLPISRVAGQRGLHLRLVPAVNHQELAINWAADYRFGAIAQLGERRAGSAKVVGSSPTSSTSRPS